VKKRFPRVAKQTERSHPSFGQNPQSFVSRCGRQSLVGANESEVVTQRFAQDQRRGKVYRIETAKGMTGYQDFNLAVG
jgi:hypothetical protein